MGLSQALMGILQPHTHWYSLVRTTFLYMLFVALFLFTVTVFIYQAIRNKPLRRRTVAILVVGDIGRSPRMMYHAESFAKRGWETAVIGYDDTPPIPSLTSLPHVHLHPIASPPRPCAALPWIARAPLRILFQIGSILKTIWYTVPVHTELLLVQNPPSIPTLLLAQIIALVSGRRTRVVVDWHNEGHSILAMRVGEGSMLVRIAKWFESTFGRSAFAHIFVTRALQSHLTNVWHLQGKSAVLYDRPPSNFRPTDTMTLHELFYRLEPQLSPPIPPDFLPRDTTNETLLSKPGVKGMPMLRGDRPALLVSSTSWTADEDFGLLLTALDAYQAAKTTRPSLPKLLVVITGKGALRATFEQEVALREGKQWTDVVVRCAFLEARDYPVLLGCADLGISLHTSSSGRDLPMKVVDMFGCGVPVLAMGFPCLEELVKRGTNGLIFDNPQQLSSQLIDTLDGFPKSCKELERLKSYFKPVDGPSRPSSRASARKPDVEPEWCSWDENWERVVYHGILGHTGGQRPD